MKPDINSEILLSAKDISMSFAQRSVLNNVNMQVSKGEIVTLIGPNGAGKSTLVKIVLGLLNPTQGQVYTSKKLRIGYMPQKLHINSTMPLTIKRFLQLAANSQSGSIKQAVDEVGAFHLLNQQINAISGGELQRVLLARALIQDPHLLVLDEPVQGVDIAGQDELYKLITSIRDQHDCGVLMVSHDLHLVMSATDEVICLNQHICCHGHPEKVSMDPAYMALFNTKELGKKGFGKKELSSLAIYTHHHNHSHDITGNIVSQEKPRG